jgi:hypothetical protein
MHDIKQIRTEPEKFMPGKIVAWQMRLALLQKYFRWMKNAALAWWKWKN